ncbi:lipase 3-like [Athalia rosae]|uniref:lipase 3-like n=1 Tax=Athalia rosae TaxID=37344 RepID=UPI00203433CA|nr:lipase 3-like [Athalia rosae]
MTRLNDCVLLACILIVHDVSEVTSFGLLKALVAPPFPRFNRIKDVSPREARALDPFAISDFMGLVKQHNYPAEEHNVITIDGYKLVMHRIPSSPNSSPARKKPIVFIQHGLMASSDCWVLMGPQKDFAFLLADAGYDVWLGNFRGNTYSRSHTVLSPEDPNFWQFSFHEMGYYDLPAMWDYVLEQTGQKTLMYVGHSMGTTAGFILLSLRPEYNKRVKLFVGFAPVAYWRHALFGVQKIAVSNADLIMKTFTDRGIFELTPQSSMMSRLVTSLCSDVAVTQPACAKAIFAFSGSDYAQLNLTLIPYISGYYPAGMSLKTLSHYAQTIMSGKFNQYDYGYVSNFAHYNQEEPPAYDLTKVTAPVALFYGLNDFISREEDAKELVKRLPNVVRSQAVSYRNFNHIDFIWANEAKQIVYDDVLELIRRYK